MTRHGACTPSSILAQELGQTEDLIQLHKKKSRHGVASLTNRICFFLSTQSHTTS